MVPSAVPTGENLAERSCNGQKYGVTMRGSSMRPPSALCGAMR